MMQFRKYFTGLILLSLAAMPAMMAVRFVVSTQIAEHKIFEQLEKGICHVHTFTKQQIQWVKEGKELLVEGKLFDVKEYRQNAGNIEVTGLFDEEEDDLQEKYKGLINRNTENPEHTSLLTIFFTPFLITIPQDETMIFCIIAVNPHRLFSEDAVNRPCHIFAPPPEHNLHRIV